MTELQTQIVALRQEGATYRTIQIKLGNPSKQFIKETLREFAPNLAGDVVENIQKLGPKW